MRILKAVCVERYAELGIRGALWLASLAARRAKPGCSRIAFEGIVHLEGTIKKYLILDIGPRDTPEPVITIGFPADF
jgi:hypothetical protein